jgi:hypothetical protein
LIVRVPGDDPGRGTVVMVEDRETSTFLSARCPPARSSTALADERPVDIEKAHAVACPEHVHVAAAARPAQMTPVDVDQRAVDELKRSSN